MSDRIDFGGRPWSAIPRAVLRDAKLSPQAKGGLVTLLSHDEGWIRSAIALLQRENTCGRERARAIMRELVDAGYAEATQGRSGGKFTTTYTIRAESGGSTASAEPTRRNAGKKARTSSVDRVGPTGDGSTVSVNPSAVVDPPDVRSQDEDPQEPTTGALERAHHPPATIHRREDGIFEALYAIWKGHAYPAAEDDPRLTPKNHDALGICAAELRRGGATAELISRMPDAWVHVFPGRAQPTWTPWAAVKHWAALDAWLTDGYVARGAATNEMDGVAADLAEAERRAIAEREARDALAEVAS